MKFIDLFAGIGGFHLALNKLGYECVFASEIDTILKDTYNKNFGIIPYGDISNISLKDIPEHDILCSGFPCQPFSKAGERKETEDARGLLLNYVEKIILNHKPSFFILENVERFGKSKLKKDFTNKVESLYNIQYIIVSPDQLGIPQHRPRIFIIGQKITNSIIKDINKLQYKKVKKNFYKIKYRNVKYVEESKLSILKLWQNIINELPKDENIYSPLWSTEYMATYPFMDKATINYSSSELNNYNGIYGTSLKDLTKNEQINLLPKYARTNSEKFPNWKIRFIKNSRDYCLKNNNVFSKYINELSKLSLSHQKLEWNIKNNDSRNLHDYIIQFRPSGIRVSKKDRFPSLVSINLTQIPIVSSDGNNFRYITTEEALALQSFPNNFILPEDYSKAFKALGNAVNVDIVYQIMKYITKN